MQQVFLPDIRGGGHGPTAKVKDLPNIFRLKKMEEY